MQRRYALSTIAAPIASALSPESLSSPAAAQKMKALGLVPAPSQPQ